MRTAVGDRYVIEKMRDAGATLGGESSGHIICAEVSPTGDGLVAGLQLLAVMLRAGRPLGEIAAEAMTRVPQVLVNATLRNTSANQNGLLGFGSAAPGRNRPKPTATTSAW